MSSGVSGFVTWGDVLDVFLLIMQEKATKPIAQPLKHDGKFK
jgi:Flp pilus assembly protein CpaB